MERTIGRVCAAVIGSGCTGLNPGVGAEPSRSPTRSARRGRVRHDQPPRAAIEVEGLRKSYGDNEAVRGIDLEVGEGEVLAMLGPNGAGKTTTVEILEGFRERDAGEVAHARHRPGAATAPLRHRIGIVLQELRPRST